MYEVVKDFPRCDNRAMGMAEEAFERLRRVVFEGEHVERMAALGEQTKLSPGVIKTLMRLGKADGVSMGEMARGIGCDPSYVTALVDDLDERGLARREPSPDDRRVKIIVLTETGRKLAAEIDALLSVPPAAFAALSHAELRQLRDLLDKVLAADVRRRGGCGLGVAESGPNVASVPCRRGRPTKFGVCDEDGVAMPAVTVEHLAKSYGDTVGGARRQLRGAEG